MLFASRRALPRRRNVHEHRHEGDGDGYFQKVDGWQVNGQCHEAKDEHPRSHGLNAELRAPPWTATTSNAEPCRDSQRYSDRDDHRSDDVHGHPFPSC